MWKYSNILKNLNINKIQPHTVKQQNVVSHTLYFRAFTLLLSVRQRAICDHLTREQSALARHHSSTDIHTISAEKHTEKERERCSLVYVPPVNALIVM